MVIKVECTASIKKGKGNFRHNDRTIKNISEKNRSWNPELSINNYVMKNEKIQDVYEELFGDALEDYNKKKRDSGRPGLQIKNYYDHISRSKQEKTHYELVIEVGNTDLIEKGSEEEKKTRQVLDEFCADFEKRNPNFKVVQMIRHEDEAMICHTHIAFVPYCKGGKKGLAVKNSLGGAFTAMGYGRNGFGKWRAAEEEELARVMARHGLEFVRADSHFNGISINEVKEKKKAYVHEAQKEIEKIQIPEKKVDEHFLTKKRTVTLDENEYDDLIKKHLLEVEKLKKEQEIEKLNKEKYRKKVQELKAKPYIQLNEQLEAKNNELSQKTDELLDEKLNLEVENSELKTKVSEIEKLKNENFKLSQKNIELTKQNNKYISSLERLLGRLWTFLKGLDRIMPTVGEYVSQSFKKAEIEFLEENLDVLQPQSQSKERE